ncbi:MAG: hypothetical protein ACNA8H_11105, partial [Anaerolineales bacterium]
MTMRRPAVFYGRLYYYMKKFNYQVALDKLIQEIPVSLPSVGSDVIVSGIASDSRKVKPGDLFVALTG